ncbi:MAG: 30S ribosomal protein S20 [Minisyncoccus archaeiphilus]|jgi:ribosomal protein S20|uniref:30S ribosomal protein S20 n=1 Tax=Minisyncoccus archaeiphilus TaxID=3238481 RepID=UPI0009CCAFAF|nr:MAG: 30S ribosomal protein S20 [Parcubacteria group bacterium ADurb.Bin216]GMX59264.1 MAG: 30S ribosomal protein S20 [Candidatus Parcubacteria bacterium]
MPITTSNKKRLRQNIKRRARNVQKKKDIKALTKEFESLLIEKKVEESKALLSKVYKIFDKAAKTGLIKSNTASRRKALYAKHLKKLEDSTTSK